MYVINSCITFIGPASMLPRARHGKKSSCHRETSSSSWTSSNHIRPMSASVSTVSNNENNWCLPGSTLAVQYSFDDSLTVLLSPEDRSVINLHLMRTSYFLFVMVVTLFCYAAVKGRSGKVKTVIHVPHDKVKSFIQP
uniref:Uncharacterized protein n=1 Tax=Arion vulgaris TaxID=1028688 RepID=A0A0B6ZS98_9EUPU